MFYIVFATSYQRQQHLRNTLSTLYTIEVKLEHSCSLIFVVRPKPAHKRRIRAGLDCTSWRNPSTGTGKHPPCIVTHNSTCNLSDGSTTAYLQERMNQNHQRFKKQYLNRAWWFFFGVAEALSGRNSNASTPHSQFKFGPRNFSMQNKKNAKSNSNSQERKLAWARNTTGIFPWYPPFQNCLRN